MVDMGTLVGTVRRFGFAGPPYEIIGFADSLPSGEIQMRILLIESGEEVEYPVSEILNDPAED